MSSLKQEDFFFYPNTEKFKEKICEFYGVDYNQLYLCAGSDLGIKPVLEAFTDGGRVISSAPSYPMYKVYSELYQCEYFGIPHEKDYTISIEKILSNITYDTDLIILANPNSPMGEYKSFDEIKPLLEYSIPVLIDEAYIEFSDNESIVNEINNYSNLILFAHIINKKSITFSTKIYGSNLFFFILSLNEIKNALITSPNLVGRIAL